MQLTTGALIDTYHNESSLLVIKPKCQRRGKGVSLGQDIETIQHPRKNGTQIYLLNNLVKVQIIHVVHTEYSQIGLWMMLKSIVINFKRSFQCSHKTSNACTQRTAICFDKSHKTHFSFLPPVFALKVINVRGLKQTKPMYKKFYKKYLKHIS